MHGPLVRIMYEDICIPRILTVGGRYIGRVCCVGNGFMVIGNIESEEIRDDLRVWNDHVDRYTNLLDHGQGWFPKVNEYFLLYAAGKVISSKMIKGFFN